MQAPVLFLQVEGKIEKVVVREEVALLEQQRYGILETIRHLKGDPESRPAPGIVDATEASRAIFDGAFDRATDEKMTAKYLEDLSKERERLRRDEEELEQLALSIEAGLFVDAKSPAGTSAVAFLVRLKQWDGPF